MVKAIEITKEVEKLLDLSKSDDWDNPGVQFGSSDVDVDSVGFCITLTNKIVERGITDGVQMFLVHHPILMPKLRPLNRVTGVFQEKCRLLASKNIFVFSAHTAWDIHPEGTRATLARVLGVKIPSLDYYNKGSCYGDLTSSQIKFAEFLALTEERLNSKAKLVVGRPDRILRRVACIGGRGLDDRELIAKDIFERNIDCIVGADSNSYCRLYVKDADACMIDMGHEETELPGIANLVKLIKPKFSEVKFRAYAPNDSLKKPDIL
ncbi:MAG: Nif3-like dinuclear metal center hexameric protein [Nitrososphaerales archaeon]